MLPGGRFDAGSAQRGRPWREHDIADARDDDFSVREEQHGVGASADVRSRGDTMADLVIVTTPTDSSALNAEAFVTLRWRSVAFPGCGSHASRARFRVGGWLGADAHGGFEDVIAAIGLDREPEAGAADERRLGRFDEENRGLAFADIDEDGRLELHVSHGNASRGGLVGWDSGRFAPLAGNRGLVP